MNLDSIPPNIPRNPNLVQSSDERILNAEPLILINKFIRIDSLKGFDYSVRRSHSESFGMGRIS